MIICPFPISTTPNGFCAPMKYFFPLFALLLISLLTANPASAQSARTYFAGYLGLNTHNKNDFNESTTKRRGDYKMDNNVSFAGALGLRINRNWRVEGEVSYRDSRIDKFNIDGIGQVKANGNIKSWMYMLNGYYDFETSWRGIQPFLSAGIGLASQKARVTNGGGFLPNASDGALNIAYQAGGGLKYRYTDSMAFTGGYRYLGTHAIESDSYDLDYRSHEFRVGFEYDLPVGWWQ